MDLPLSSVAEQTLLQRGRREGGNDGKTKRERGERETMRRGRRRKKEEREIKQREGALRELVRKSEWIREGERRSRREWRDRGSSGRRGGRLDPDWESNSSSSS